MDPKSIISTRRFFALLFVSTLIWIVPVLISVPFSSFLNNAIVNEFIFGAFLAWGFELVIVNGAFVKSATQSLLISAIHPIPIMLLILSGSSHDQLYPLASGAVVILTMLVFLLRINSVKTRKGVQSLNLLRAFLKTWVEKEPEELETYFASYAKSDSVVTDLIIAQNRDDKIVLVVPGIHPGPFSPVGSYNLSELIYGKLNSANTIPIVLHGTGGHERNVPTNEIATLYASSISEFASLQKDGKKTLLRGPLRSKVGITNITTIGFDNQILILVSNSPYRSDDFDPSAIAGAYGAAADLDIGITVVDAHNSIDGQEKPQEPINKTGWTKLLNSTLGLEETEFKTGAANSSEIQFEHGTDVSDGGISVVMLATPKSRWVLISADSNNAKSGLKEKLVAELDALCIQLVELCTSDTHKLAARNHTSRGYYALGEQTSFDAITNCVKELVTIAQSRLASYTINVSHLKSEVPLVGDESLADFAELTSTTIALTKRYTKIIIPALLILLTITLFY